MARKKSRPKQKSLFEPINKATAGMMDKRCSVCGKRSSGFGFKPPGQPLKWFCSQHKADGEKYLLDIPGLLL